MEAVVAVPLSLALVLYLLACILLPWALARTVYLIWKEHQPQVLDEMNTQSPPLQRKEGG